jgi:putative transcriptional regulator
LICYNALERRREMAKNLKLKAARAAKDMSQKQLADAVDVARQTINLIELGDYNPSIRLCAAICRVLGKTLNDLFWEEEHDENEAI